MSNPYELLDIRRPLLGKHTINPRGIRTAGEVDEERLVIAENAAIVNELQQSPGYLGEYKIAGHTVMARWEGEDQPIDVVMFPASPQNASSANFNKEKFRADMEAVNAMIGKRLHDALGEHPQVATHDFEIAPTDTTPSKIGGITKRPDGWSSEASPRIKGQATLDPDDLRKILKGMEGLTQDELLKQHAAMARSSGVGR